MNQSSRKKLSQKVYEVFSMSLKAPNLFFSAAAFALILSVSCTAKSSTAHEAQKESETSSNLIKNGDFSSGKKFWDIFLSNGSADMLATENGELEVKIKNPGSYEYAVQLYFDGFSLYKGGVYKYSFDVRSSIERTFEWRLQKNGGDYHAYAGGWASAGPDAAHIEHVFTMEEATDFLPRLAVNIGFGKGCPEGMKAHSVFFDNFILELVDSSRITEIVTSRQTANVNLNQAGYFPSDKKIAVVRSKGSEKIKGTFDVIDTESGKTVYSGKLKKSRQNEASAEQTALADFSKLKSEGTYKISAGAYGESFPFSISKHAYSDLFKSALRFFYLQRCGTAVEDASFSHPACHASRAVVYGDVETSFDVSGGWHDAGDYGRYVVPAAKAVCDLLLAFENYPQAFPSADSILDEVQYELDWMLKMQLQDSGAVFHKVTCKDFPGEVMPQDETDRLVLCPVSTAATADFAAAMAMASRIYAGRTESSRYAAAAKKAWEYLEKTPSDGKGFSNPILFTTGAYDDAHDEDERFWAAAELYKTFKDESYLSYIKQADPETIGKAFGWQQVGLYGLYAYLTSGAPKDAFFKKAEKAFLAQADEKLRNAAADSYAVSLTKYEYVWGSNMCAANNGMLLLLADLLSPHKKYVSCAKSQLDYLLGTNTNSYCFVTGFGTLSPTLPHHRPSQVVRKAMPGMLVGGPDFKLEDPFARANLSDAPHAACYIDSVQSYSCNEVTIYWNSPLVYLLAGCSTLQNAD